MGARVVAHLHVLLHKTVCTLTSYQEWIGNCLHQLTHMRRKTVVVRLLVCVCVCVCVCACELRSRSTDTLFLPVAPDRYGSERVARHFARRQRGEVTTNAADAVPMDSHPCSQLVSPCPEPEHAAIDSILTLSSSHSHPHTLILTLPSSHSRPHTLILTLPSSHMHTPPLVFSS